MGYSPAVFLKGTANDIVEGVFSRHQILSQQYQASLTATEIGDRINNIPKSLWRSRFWHW